MSEGDIKKYVMTVALVAGLIPCLSANEWFGSANSMDEKSWSIGAYHQAMQVDPVIDQSGSGSIQVPVSGGGSVSIFNSGNAEVEMEQNSQANVALFKFRPRSGLQYSVRIGQVSDFELEFSSGSQVNKLESTKDGIVWGLGLGHHIAVGSIVSAAISWDISYLQTRVDLDRFEDPSGVTAASQRIMQDEAQAAVNISRRWKMIEPYAGLKLLWLKTKLQDKSTKSSVSGHTEGISPFVGIEIALAEREFLTVEGSFVDQKSISAGLNIQF